MLNRLLQRARWEADPPFDRRVFVNRNLRMETIEVVCFDLDWTLAAYQRELLQRLIFETAIERLIEGHEYDETLRTAEFRPDFAHRGLLIDKACGTVIKMDRHRYVGRGFLGRRRLSSTERLALYRSERIDLTKERFYHVDTLFDLAEVNLFSELVELVSTGAVHHPVSYERIAADVRTAVDGIHHDGTLKSKVIKRLETLLPPDEEIPMVVRKLALSGKKILLVSNSEWEYTNAICQHLFGACANGPWRSQFDMIVVGASKPQFFTKRNPFIELDEQGETVADAAQPRWGGIFSGGSRDGLSQFLGVPGERVLYVGDHIYSDIVATRMQSTWRTMLIVSELEEELRVGRSLLGDTVRLTDMNSVISDLGQQLDSVRDVKLLHRLTDNESSGQATSTAELLDQLTAAHEVLRRRARLLNGRIAGAFNAYWGSVFKQGSSKSLFASQVDDFACLYTSRVSNLLNYGNLHYFRVNSDPMPHEHPVI